MAPEVSRGEPATPAADAYSLGVMFVYLLTGIWYTPGSKVFRVLETLDYRWAETDSGILHFEESSLYRRGFAQEVVS